MVRVFTADNRGMASAAFVIKDRKYADVHMQMILVEIYIVG